MFPPCWYFITDTSARTEKLFSAIGKLLYVATRYESYCRSLRTLIDLKTAVANNEVRLDDKDSVDQLVESIHRKKLNDHVQKVCTSLGLESPFSEILISGKNARNHIAHELTLGLETAILPECDQLDAIYEDLSTTAMSLLRAESVVLRVTGELTHDEQPPRDYISKNRNWVLAGT